MEFLVQGVLCFLDQIIIELIVGRFVWVREGDSNLIAGSVSRDMDNVQGPVLYAELILDHNWGRQAWQYGEWTCIFLVGKLNI